MAGKILIEGNLIVLTGLHIGGSDSYSAIGSIDSPVIRTPVTGLPFIPGSSLKGKLRTLLTRRLTDGTIQDVPDEPNDDKDEIKRLFGSSEKNKIKRSRLQFADSYINKDYLNGARDKDGALTEIKAENAINRITSEANPRFIERVVPGTSFDLKIVYDVDKEDEVLEDLNNLATALRLLQLDYLGGHGTRGSGRVNLKNFKFKLFEITSPEVKEAIQKAVPQFTQVNNYELLNL